MDILLLFQILALIVGAYSQSYSQVRYASTRRNGSAYDAYSVLSNPALANHRLPIYPQQPTNSPITSPPETTTTTTPAAAVDVQSAVQDAIQQGNFHKMPFYATNHLVPQYTDTLNTGDLQPAHSEVHQVRVPPKTTPQMNEEEERIRDYYHHQTETPTAAPEPETTTDCLACRIFHEEFVKNQEKIKFMTNKHTPAPQNALPEAITKVMTTPKPKPVPVDKKNFTAPATNELFSINDALVHQQKLPAQFGSVPNAPAHVVTPTELFNRPQTVVNRLPNGFVMPPQNFGSNPPQGSHLLPPGAILIDPTRGVKPQMFSSNQQGQNMPINAGPPPQPMPQPANMAFNSGLPQPSNIPKNPEMKPMSNFKIPQGSNIAKMPGMPQGLPQAFLNAGSPGANMPINPGLLQNLMNAATSQGSNINPALLQSLMNAATSQGSNINPALLQSLMNAATSQGSNMQISPALIQKFMNAATSQGSNIPFSPQPQQAPNAFNPQTPPNGIAAEPNRRVNAMPNDPTMSNPQQGTIRGPMGIHIPIPPKSVPAHTVMGPPMSMPPMQNSNGMPIKKNGGFLDSIKNFFAGSMFSNNGQRARFLDDDEALLLDEDNNSTVIDELIDNKNISSNETLDDITEVPEVEGGLRTKREVEKNETITFESIKNGSKSLLEEIGAYVRKTIHRLRDETEKITTPLWPSIRDTVRTYFGSSKSESATTRKPETVEEKERRSAEIKRYTTSSGLDDEDIMEDVGNKRKFIEQDIQKILRVGETTEQLKLAAATSLLPRCALDMQNKNYCLQDSDYPINLLKEALQQDEFVIDCNTTLGTFRQRLNNAEIGVCLSPVFKVRPLRAKNQDGEWKIIVNIDTCHQTVRIQKCHPSCAGGTTNSSIRTNCKQVQTSLTLLAFDSKHGFHLDKFQFP
uniref:Spaetzle domain-containing protein n=1 Tax=Strigamia maritima TaxID=126957 RepID=T1IT91_STRMM